MGNSMRILYIIPALDWACGASRQLCNISQGLAGLGHKIEIAYFFGNVPEGMVAPSVGIHHICAINAYDPLILWRILRLQKFIKPHIVQTWFMQVDVFGGVAAQLSKIPWVIREPGSGQGYSSLWKERLRFMIAKKADAIVANSEGGKQYWDKHTMAKNCRIIRNGLRINTMAVAADIQSLETGPNSASKTILFVGRLEEVKNIPIMLSALKKVREVVSIQAIFVGDGPERHKLEEQVRQSEMETYIRFTGALPNAQVIALMKQANLMLFLSKHEGFPNAVVEAMGCSCPLIVSDIPAHREFLDGRSALFVNPYNISEILNAVKNCLSHPGEAKIRAEVAKKLADQWTIEKSVKEYEDLYTEILRSRNSC